MEKFETPSSFDHRIWERRKNHFTLYSKKYNSTLVNIHFTLKAVHRVLGKQHDIAIGQYNMKHVLGIYSAHNNLKLMNILYECTDVLYDIYHMSASYTIW